MLQKIGNPENMQKYLIDSCVLIDLLRKGSEIESVFFEKGASTSVITLCELYYGAEKSSNPKKSTEKVAQLIEMLDIEILDFDFKKSEIFAKTKAILERKGERLDDFDLLIASTAIAENIILVTNNTKHFNRIKNLKITTPTK